MRQKPLLLVDVDGVISLFGSPAPWTVDGIGGDASGIPGEPIPGEQPIPGEPIPGEQPAPGIQPDGSLHTIEGIPHFLSRTAAAHLHELSAQFDLVWASGWEERADEHLPHLLGLPAGLPHLRFEPQAGQIRSSNAHWKLDAIDAYARARPMAWIDDTFNVACHEWAAARTAGTAPTLLVQTDPARGLTSTETRQLLAWAREN
jgi:hypothetical protein